MLLHYYTHSLLFYLSLPTFQRNSDLTKTLQNFDYEYLPQEVCVAQCLERKNKAKTSLERLSLDKDKNQTLKFCLDHCSIETSSNQTRDDSKQPAPKQIHENYSLNLICRDDTSLNFNIDLHRTNSSYQLEENRSADFIAMTTTSSPISSSSLDILNETTIEVFDTIFVIKVQLANETVKVQAYLSDDNFFTLDQLLPNTTYNISVWAVHSNNKYSVIAQQQQFLTLRRSYTPNNVTEIKITHFTQDKVDKMHLTATMTWKPGADMTCHYDIICFSPESEDYDLQPLEIRNPRQLFKHQLENLTFSSMYKVGIRSSNTKNMRESELFWKTFSVPSCVEWHNYNFNICAPEAPQNLQVVQTIVDKQMYSLNISWLLPAYLPENYTLRVHDLSKDGKLTVYELAKDIHNFFIPQLNIYGVFYEVSLTAYTRGGRTTTVITDLTKNIVHIPEKNTFVKLIALILAPIFCVAILSLTIFIIYHRRAKLKRYQKRCKYFEELEKKAPIDPKHNFDISASWRETGNSFSQPREIHDHMLYDDDMEIDRNNLILHQVLGEGAFGLVKLGLYTDKKMGTSQEVAVKMLKDHPSAEDIYAFRREIEVMKSVERHPNIVGLIGHCTRFSNEIMLVTEYCSFGNLLNFLRDEWHFLHEQQIKRQRLNANIAYIELNQADSSSQDSSLPRSPQRYSFNNLSNSNEVDSTKNHKTQTVTHVLGDSENNDIIERFQIKYKDISGETAIECSNNNIQISNLQHVEDLNATTYEEPPITEIDRNVSTAITFAPAAENKSYGYHGFCTNSCKCNVDVIIKNIDATDTSKQVEQLDNILKQQSQLLGTTETQGDDRATIKIKDCNCKMQEQNRLNITSSNNNNNVAGGAVENKSYFDFLSANIDQTTTPEAFSDDCNEDNDEESQHSNRVPLSCGDLINIARQVAVGMEFLAKNKVVHRDLAARNVLVAPDRTIKIADFGLSRDVYQENMYKKTGNGKLPIKWLALESMTHQVYTTQSDVWSYGILLYEIVTLGATPYPSISTNRLLHLLKSGYRMERPKGCDKDFYDLMYTCWNAEPLERPTFTDITDKLNKMLDNLDETKDAPTIYSEVDKDISTKPTSIQTSDDSYLKPL